MPLQWPKLQITWWRHQMEHFPRHWPCVREIHRSPVNSPHTQRPVTRSFDLFAGHWFWQRVENFLKATPQLQVPNRYKKLIFSSLCRFFLHKTVLVIKRHIIEFKAPLAIPGHLLLTEIGSTSITIRARISNHIHVKQWNVIVITHPCPYFNGGLANRRWSKGMDE